MCRSHLRASAHGKPADAVNETLISMFVLQEGGRVLGFISAWDGINSHTQRVGSRERMHILGVLLELFNKVICEAR